MDLTKFKPFIERTNALKKSANLVPHGSGNDLGLILAEDDKTPNEEGKILHKAFPDLKVKKRSLWDSLKEKYRK